MIKTWMSIAASFVCLATAGASDWTPIPPEVWAMKEDPAKEIKGAIVLEDRTVFKNTYVERIYRVRVISEAGRAAAELPVFSEECYSFNGRTVYPDGKVIKFNKRQDFQEETNNVGDFSHKKTVVIPPGVNGNCVVELSWLESANHDWGFPLPKSMGFQASWRFGGPYYTILESVEIPISFPWPYNVLSGRTFKCDFKEKSGFKIFSARDLPAMEQPPYSLSVSLDRPIFSVFYQPNSLYIKVKQGSKAYWDGVGSELYKPDFESDIKKGDCYAKLKEKLLSRVMKMDKHAAAIALLPMLEAEIRNTSYLTFEEAAKFSKKDEIPESKNLEAACEKKYTSGRGMRALAYHLLKDAGFDPKIALVVGRDTRLFRQGTFNPWQFTDELIVLEEPGKGQLFLDPYERFVAPGLIHPDYQGVQGLLLDPKAGWTAQPFDVPIQAATGNQRRYEYSLTLGEEEDQFKVKAQFAGVPEFAERRRYMACELKEQNRRLKEILEKQLKGAQIKQAEVQNATNPNENVSWVFEGSIEREITRQRQVEPFPGMPYPLHIPDSFPKERSLAIVMPYLQLLSARSTFKVPKGYRASAGQPFEKRNSLGHVTWSTKLVPSGEDTLAVVTLMVGVDSMFAAPESYEDLKNFLDWISQAYRRTLILEKG